MEQEATPDVDDQKPKAAGHLKLLSETDLNGYFALRDRFHKEVANAKRGEKVDMFSKRLKIIKEFVVKNDSDDWKRSFATGVIFLENSIAINIKQLIVLMGKCKSSINGSLHQLGYIARPASKETDEQLVLSIPIFSKDRRELKKWTIRQKRNARRRNAHKVVKEEIQNEEDDQKVEISAPVHPISVEALLNDNPPTPPPSIPVLAKTAEDAWNAATKVNFPVPVKFRYKMFSSYYQPLPVV